MNNSIVISLRIDSEIRDYINFLKLHKIKHNDIIRDSIKQVLKEKCIEFKIDHKINKCPF